MSAGPPRRRAGGMAGGSGSGSGSGSGAGPSGSVERSAVVRRAVELHRRVFGCLPTLGVFAPGRVNVIGEHTDYQRGLVLPCALPFRTAMLGRGRLLSAPAAAAAAAASDTAAHGQGREDQVQVCSEQAPGQGQHAEIAVVRFTATREALVLGRESEEEEEEEEGKDGSAAMGPGGWARYVKGVVAQYAEFIEPGKHLSFEAVFVSNVPIGAGLSSSAALEVATATFVERLLGFGHGLKNKIAKAERCQRAEHEWANVPCGIMDQMVSATAEFGHCVLIDCKTNVPRLIQFNAPSMTLVVTNSNVHHNLGTSEYPVRVKQCQDAVRVMQKIYGNEIRFLRDVTVQQVRDAEDSMKDVTFRRALHVVTENERVQRTVEALEEGDMATVGRLMNESHASLSADFEVSCPELDLLVHLALQVPGVMGSRMTGGGFGGCTVTLVRKDAASTLQAFLKREYTQQSNGKQCDCYVVVPNHGARLLDMPVALESAQGGGRGGAASSSSAASNADDTATSAGGSSPLSWLTSPSALVLLAAAAIGVLAYVWRRGMVASSIARV